jgi:lipoprotein NlpI
MGIGMWRLRAGVMLLCGLVAGCETARYADNTYYDYYDAEITGGSGDAGEKCRQRSERGFWKEAVEACTFALSNPAITKRDRGQLEGYLVSAYVGLEEYDKALASANQQLAVYPNFHEALEDRARVYSLMKDDVRALADLGRALELEPRSTSAYVSRAIIYGTQDKLDLAMADLDRALEHDPNDAYAYRIRCRFKLHQGKLPEALSDCSQALELAPSYSLAKVEKGAAQYLTGDYRGAVDTLADFMSYQQEEPYGLLWLHLARRRLGIDDAAVLKEQAQRLDSGRWPALIVRYFEGQVSRETIESAKPDPDPELAGSRRCDIDYFVGEAEVVAGRVDEGRRLLKHAVAQCPSGHIAGVGARAALERM